MGLALELRSGGRNQTPLNKAAQSGLAEAVKTLVNAGANLEAVNASGHTPLHEAVAEGETESVRILVRAGADITARTPKGASPAELSADSGREDAAEVLRELAPTSG